MSGCCKRSWSPYTQGRFTPYDQPERAQCHHINWRQEEHGLEGSTSVQMKGLDSIQNMAIMPVGHEWGAPERWSGHSQWGPTNLWAMSPRKPEVTLQSRHGWARSPHMAQINSEILQLELILSGVMRVTQTLTDANISASFWGSHTHTHIQMGQSAALTWNQLATGPQDEHEFTGASGRPSVPPNSGQPQAPKGLTN